MEEKEAEEALGRLLEGDGGRGSTGAKYLAVLDKRKTKVKKGIEGEEGKERKMRPFSAGAIKKIGFDPTSRGPRDGEDVAKRVSRDTGYFWEVLITMVARDYRFAEGKPGSADQAG